MGNNLYTSDQSTSGGAGGNTPNSEKNALNSLKNKLSSKNVGGLGNAASDMAQSLSDLGKQGLKSIKDKFQSSNSRNTANTANDSEFRTEDVSIENLQKDAIKNILTDTYNGNLWDAGISAVNLYNVGTKWKIYLDQLVDKDSYSFKYWYYLQGSDSIVSNGRAVAETDDIKKLQFLDTIEDPTILSVSFKIDAESSQLFKGDVTSQSTTSNRSVAETNDDPQHIVNTKSALTNFITAYKKQHQELEYAFDYLEEFKRGILQIFESPETLDNNKYHNQVFKNHYVFKVEGLEKLDNLFVEYKSTEDKMFGTEQESLTFILNEDVRMFTNRLAFLYRNLTYSYNMGKKLIPENLLRFNLYIKVSDMRNFTRSTDDSDVLRESMRNEYSRVIYELKDCEFFFGQSLNPSSLSMGGFSGINTDYANLQLKVKYRKVNRIFYSTLYDGSYSNFIIGDKYYKPNTKWNNDFLNSTKFGPKNTIKRAATTNNIIKSVGLGEKLDTLKHRGLFNTDENDTALGRFAKTIGNDAVKAGAQVVSDGVQSLKNTVNTKIGGSVRSFLQSNIAKKTLDLGYVNNNPKQVREVKTNMSIATPLEQDPESLYTVNDQGVITNVAGIPSSASYLYNSNVNPLSNIILNSNNPLTTHKNNDEGSILVPGTSDAYTNKDYKYESTKPNEDLHPSLNKKYDKPNEDLHPSLNKKYVSPNEDLHPTLNNEYDKPNEDLHPSLNKHYDIPAEDLHPSLNKHYDIPAEDLHPDMNNVIVNPKEDLHPSLNKKYVDPNEDLQITPKHSIKSPNEDLHIVGKYSISDPNEDLMQGGGSITQPNENLNGNSNNKIVDPKDNVNSKSKNKMEDPNGDVNPNVNHKYIQPDEFPDLKSFKDFLKKNKGGKDI